MMYQIIVLVILIILLYLFSKKVIKYLIYSPFYLYITFNLITLILTIAYQYFYNNSIDMFRLETKTTSTEFLNLIKFQLIHLNSFIFGGLFIHNFTSKTIRRNYLLHKFPTSIRINIGNSRTLLYVSFFLTIILVIIFLLISGKAIFIRESYLPKEGSKFLMLIVKLLSIVVAFLLAVVHKENKTFSNILFFVVLILNLSTGSRFTFIILIIYVVLLYNDSKKSLLNNFLFLFNIILSLLFLAYIIQLRKLDTHGLIPYLSYFFESFNEIIHYFIFNIYYMFIFGNFAAIDTIDRGLTTWQTIRISLNPLPGSMVGWYNHASTLRINRYTPYTSHGEIFRMGAFFTSIFYFIIGVIVTRLDFYFRKHLLNKEYLFAIIIILFVGLHLMYAFEYNLRSAVRYLYYIIFILFISKLFRILLKSLRKKENIIEKNK